MSAWVSVSVSPKQVEKLRRDKFLKEIKDSKKDTKAVKNPRDLTEKDLEDEIADGLLDLIAEGFKKLGKFGSGTLALFAPTKMGDSSLKFDEYDDIPLPNNDNLPAPVGWGGSSVSPTSFQRVRKDKPAPAPSPLPNPPAPAPSPLPNPPAPNPAPAPNLLSILSEQNLILGDLVKVVFLLAVSQRMGNQGKSAAPIINVSPTPITFSPNIQPATSLAPDVNVTPNINVSPTPIVFNPNIQPASVPNIDVNVTPTPVNVENNISPVVKSILEINKDLPVNIKNFKMPETFPIELPNRFMEIQEANKTNSDKSLELEEKTYTIYEENDKYNKTAKDIRDIEGSKIANISPRDAEVMKNTLDSRIQTDENNFDPDDIPDDEFELEDILSLFKLDSRLDMQKELLKNIK